ncbi:hypothetical protein IL306_010983 [Fusarium sp. DS 682]|nr:hypothetical protein IL306_010983 [Fusarium sp. DS 682]
MANQTHTDTNRFVPDDNMDSAAQMHDLAVELHNQYYDNGEAADLDKAVKMARNAIEQTPHKGSNQAKYLRHLGHLLCVQGIHSRSSTILDDAAEAARQAAEAVPKESSDRLEYLHNLTRVLWARDQHTGRETHLMESIRASRDLVHETQENNPDRPRYCFEMALVLAVVWYRNNDIRAVEEPISLLRHTVRRLLRDQYVYTNGGVDPTEAILVAREAVEAISQNHRMASTHLNSLGTLMEDKFCFTREKSDLDEAVEILKRSVSTSHEDDPSLPVWLSDLGISIHTRYDLAGSLDDLNESIELARKALSSLPEGDPVQVDFTFNLVCRLGSRHNRTGSLLDLEEAIKLAQNVLELTPESHPSRCSLLHALGNRLSDITYEGLLEKNLSDDAVSWGLHHACRDLRDRWVEMVKGDNRATKQVQIAGNARLPRDIVSCEEEPVWPPWIPYIHYGV